MEIKLTIPEYSAHGLALDWEKSFEIQVSFDHGAMMISANKAGLISLAKQLLTLAQDEVPKGAHLHYDEYNSLEVGSADMIIEKR